MSIYSRTLKHVNHKDFRRTHQRYLGEQEVLRKIKEEKLIQEKKELEEIKKLSSPFKSNWRKELNEGMTTGGGEIQLAPTDVPLDSLDAANAASFTAAIGGFDATNPQDGLMGAQIVSNGTGSGSNGGFNLGRSYLSFNGVGFDLSGSGFEGFDNTRKVIFTPVDASRATTLEVTAIVGNGSNGGEAPSIGQDITFGYTLADEIGLITPLDDDENPFVVVPYNGSGSLRTYSFTIPDDLRIPGIQFVLGQFQGTNPTTTNDNYGITQIKIKRTTPISVIAPLDTPEAISFFRVGTGPNMETPEQRYRRIMQQLLASRSYTNQMFGSNYPGSNFAGLRGVSASPIGRQASYDTWSRASERNAARAASTFASVETDYQPGITFTTQYADPSDRGPYKVSVAGPTNVRAALPGRQSRTSGGNAASAGRGAGQVAMKSGGPSRTSGPTAVGRGGPLETVRGAARAASAGRGGGPNTGAIAGVIGGVAAAAGLGKVGYDMYKKATAGSATPTPSSRGRVNIPPMPPAPTTGYSTRGAEIPRSSAARFAGTPGGPPLSKSPTVSPRPTPSAGTYGPSFSGYGKDLQGKPLPKPGPQSPLPPTSRTNPTTRVKDFGARMDALRNPSTGGARDILPPQQGPQRVSRDGNISSKAPSPASKAPVSSAKPTAKPSFTPQQQQNIKSVQSQLRNVVSNVGVKFSPVGVAAAVFKPTAAGNPTADRNPQQYTKQMQQQYAQKAAASGQFGKYAPPPPPRYNPAPSFQNTGGYGRYAPPPTLTRTPAPPPPSQYNPGGGRQQYNQSRSSAPPPPPPRYNPAGGRQQYNQTRSRR